MRTQSLTNVVTYSVLGLAAGICFLLPDSLVAERASAASPAPPPIIRLNGFVRDFKSTHPDFDATLSEAPGHVAGMVQYDLGPNGTPISSGTGQLVTAEARDASGNNIAPVLANGGAAQGVAFTISAGKAIPSASFVAKMTVLGAAMQNPYAQMHVSARLRVGTTTVDPWGAFTSATASNVMDNNNPRNYIMATPMPAGTALSVIGKSWYTLNGTTWTTLITTDTSTATTAWCKVLKNGDSVPNIKPFNGQQSITSFLVGYINTVTQKVTIASNQAIYLIELATNDPTQPFCDFQDLGVLLTMAKGPEAFAAGKPANEPTCGPSNDTNATYGATSKAGVTNANTFQQWFTDSLGVNMSASAPLDLTQQTVQGTSQYVFDDKTDPRYSKLGGFYPADGRMLGDRDASGHNQDFSYSFDSSFTYDSTKPQFFEVASDAEVWVFIDGKLVIDMGGFHGSLKERIDLSRLCLTSGSKYKVQFFMAHRYESPSSLKIATNLQFTSSVQQTVLAPGD